MNQLRKAWRKRLASQLRRFRKMRGYWPSREILSAAKRGIADAVLTGVWPPVEH